MQSTIKVYGSETCGDTARTRAHLEQLGLEYQFIDIDQDSDAEQQVITWNNGKRVMPTLELLSHGENRRLSNPSRGELDQAIRESRIEEEGDRRIRRAG